MNSIENKAVKALYQQIFAENRPQIEAGGVGDEFLRHPEQDTRMSVTLLFRVEPLIAGQIQSCIGELRALVPELYFYQPDSFHVTLLDILDGRPNRALPQKNALQAYQSCIIRAVRDVGPFPVQFSGLTASASAVLVKGYYQQGVQEIREALRQQMRRQGLPLEERCETRSCHITIARVVKEIARPPLLLNYLARNQTRDFGAMTVRAIDLVYHDWYDSKKHTLFQIVLP